MINQFKQLVFSPQHDVWIKIKSLVLQISKKQSQKLVQYLNEIKQSMSNVPRLTTYIYLYFLLQQYGIHPQINQPAVYLQKRISEYQKINIWLLGRKSLKISSVRQSLITSYKQVDKIKQKSVELVLFHYVQLLTLQRVRLMMADISFIFKLLNLYPIETDLHMKQIKRLIERLTSVKNQQIQKIKERQIAIFDSIVKCATKGIERGNLGLLLSDNFINYPVINKNNQLQQNTILTYFQRNSDYLLDLSQAKLLKLLKQFTISNISYNSLLFVRLLCEILVQIQQYYKILYLLQNFILPEFVVRNKNLKNKQYNMTVIAICQNIIYPMNLSKKIGKNGLFYLLFDLSNVPDNQNKKKWLYMAKQIALRQDILNIYNQLIRQQNLRQQQLLNFEQLNTIKSKYKKWATSQRNLRKRKQYNMNISNKRGIINPASQCYMISVIQALFHTKQLPLIIYNLSQINKGLLFQLNVCFQQLNKINTNQSVSIKNLKAKGPKYFAKSKISQDAHDYLLGLFQSLQLQLNSIKMQKLLRDIFQFQITQILDCLSCQIKSQKKRQQFILSIGNQKHVQLSHTQIVKDRKCVNCNQLGVKITQNIGNRGTIFIIHLNCFKMQNGEAIKQLSMPQIPRYLKDYQLKTMIFHTGSSIKKGHYTTYTKISSKKWIISDDTSVKQFQLQQDDELFQLQFRRGKTPYMLFYSPAI